MKPLRKKRLSAPVGDRRLEPAFVPDDEPQTPESGVSPEPVVGEQRTRPDGTTVVCVGRDPQVLADPDTDWSFMGGGWLWADEDEADRVYQDDLGEYWLRGADRTSRG